MAAMALPVSVSLSAQTRTVALTIDDLPFVRTGGIPSLKSLDAQAATANRKLLKAITRHKVPVTGFVIEKSVEELGLVPGQRILREWIRRGLDLGTHSYAHPDFDTQTVEELEDQIIRGETTFAPLMRTAGRKPAFFRFPYNHTGNTKEKHDAVSAFLAQRGYRLAPCTIENSDWMFNMAYAEMRVRHDRRAAARLREAYLAYTSPEIDYFSTMNRVVLGYEPPEIMLIHDNQLNADVIVGLLKLFEQRDYYYVTLTQAEMDPVYEAPDASITGYGPMWGYRWAKERAVKLDGSLEPDPPNWVSEYGKDKPVPARRHRTSF